MKTNIKARNILLDTFLIIIIFNISSYVQAKPKLDTESEVTNYISKITDFKSIEGLRYSFQKMDITEDNTPFLHEKVKGRKNVWLVEAKDFHLKLKKADPNSQDQYIRNFRILMDPNNGNLLKISSKYDGNDPDVGTEPNAANAEKYLGGENYSGFPDTPPQISFLDALDIVADFGIGHPYYAKEMDAKYIWYSNIWDIKELQRVWVINLRGIPSIPHSNTVGDSPVNIRQVNHIRYVINADTGKILKCNNGPIPKFEKSN